jgi:hypothetical protein
MGVGLAIYCACVDFMLHAARLFGFTYRDANALLFFVLWPAATVALGGVIVVQRRRLRAFEEALARAKARRSPR